MASTNPPPLHIPRYPAFNLFVRHGTWLMALIASLPVAGVLVFMALGASAWWLVPGAIVSILGYLLLHALLDLMRILADFILPK